MHLNLTPDIYRAVLESLPFGIYLTDSKRQIGFWNAAAEKITGYLAQEVIGHFCHDNLLMHCDENQVAVCGGACPLAHTMLNGEPREANLFLRHKDGQRVPVRVRSMPVRDEFGTVIGAAEFFEEHGSLEVQMRRAFRCGAAEVDEATAIPDRAALSAILGAALAQYADTEFTFGVLSIAVDKLAHIRQVYGRQAIDQVLYVAAQTLESGVHRDDVVARWKEERFAAVVICRTEDELKACAAGLQRLVSTAGVPWWGDRITFTVSIGGTMVRSGDTKESILDRADATLASAAAPQHGSVLIV